MKKNNRVVILGGGFISTSVFNYLKKKNKKVILFRKKKIDLSRIDQTKKLLKIINLNDTIFFSAALAPVKDKKMYDYNIKIANNFSKILKNLKLHKMIYLSSDAVYSDTKKKITEKSKTIPDSLHGMMHLKREKIFKKILKDKLIIIRPTLVYGPNDPHNGYGPNKFIRAAKRNSSLVLFGKGEEKRDHIYINDLKKIVYAIINKRSKGIYNLASGKVISFNKIAKIIKFLSKNNVKILYTPRKGSMPHGGFRAFDVSKIKRIYRNSTLTKISKFSLRKIVKQY